MDKDKNRQNMKRVLLVDDDKKYCALVKEYLSPFGFELDCVHRGDDGLVAANEGDYHAIILDVMLPGMDGFEILRQIRKNAGTPVLMLTAKGEETDRIVGLEMGADDYLPKTFSARELLARLRAVIRRSVGIKPTHPKAETVEYEPPIIRRNLQIDPASRKASLGKKTLELTPIEFDLLLILAKHAGRVLSRDQLLDKITGRDYEIFDRSIDVHISSLRKKLGDSAKTPRFIQTIRTVGYMFLDEEDIS